MFKLVRMAVLVALVIVGSSAASYATFLDTFLTSGTQNTLRDNSFEAWYDANNDGVFGQGDVLVGFLQIDAKTQPNSVDANNSIYAIFSAQIVAPILDAGITNQGLVTFGATTVAGLTMSDLIGAPVDANTLVAVYTAPGGFTTDLSVAAPGDTVPPAGVTLADYFNFLKTNGTLELTAGLIDGNDFFRALAEDADLLTAEFQAPTETQIDTSGSNVNFATFGAALSIILNNTQFTFGTLPTNFAGLVGFGELIVTGGAVNGAAGTSPDGWMNLAGLAANGQCGPDTAPNPCGFANDADFTVLPVPEPSSMILLGFGLAALGIYGRRARNRQKTE